MTRTQSELALATVQDRTLALTHTLSVATDLCKRVLALMASFKGEIKHKTGAHTHTHTYTHDRQAHTALERGRERNGEDAQLSPSA